MIKTADTTATRRLKAWLKQHGHTQTWLASKLDVSKQAVAYWLSDNPEQRLCPGAMSQIAIAIVTGGAVTPRDWLDASSREFVQALERQYAASAHVRHRK